MAPTAAQLYTPLDTEANPDADIDPRCTPISVAGQSWERARVGCTAAYQRLVSTPNLSELVAVALVYLVQGVTDLATLAQKYLLKDELGASPAQVAFILSAAGLPWTVKPIIGLVSDTVPLWGYRRKSYLVAAGLAGALGWLLLSLTARSMGGALGLIMLTSAASAVSDVVVDSMVVERARREEQADSGSLQSLCWASYAVGQIGSAYLSGSLVDHLGPRPVFALTALLPLLVVLVGLSVRETRGPGVLERMRRLWQGDEAADDADSPSEGPGPVGQRQRTRRSRRRDADVDKRLPLRPLHGAHGHGSTLAPDPSADDLDLDQGLVMAPVGRRAADREEQMPLKASTSAAGGSSGGGSSDDASSSDGDGGEHRRHSYRRRGGGGAATRLAGAARSLWRGLSATSGQLWATVRRPEVAAPVLFLFCSSVTPAADDAMFFFMTGVGIYHAFLRRRPLRCVLLWGTVLAALFQASSLVLATRANVALGLDDHLFALGDSVMVSVIQNVLFMPTMVLAARLCPPGMEATLFATIMSISNIASGLRYMFGGLLMQLLGVTSTDFRGLPALLAICSFSLLLPLPLLLLVPRQLDRDGDEGRTQGEGQGERGGGAEEAVEGGGNRGAASASASAGEGEAGVPSGERGDGSDYRLQVAVVAVAGAMDRELVAGPRRAG